MNNRDQGIKTAEGDSGILFFVCAMMIFTVFDKWGEDWGLVTICIIFLIPLGFFFFARIYHLTHKDEVFGKDTNENL